MNLDTQIYELAVKNGFTDKAARLIVAQARLESNNYTSNVFKNNNNMFGMKFLGTTRQPLATRGTLAPLSERSTICRVDQTKCNNSDFYAKYLLPTDSAKDLITRLYAITRNGITPQMLKTAETPEQFADLLKKRNYYGSSVKDYAAGLRSRLKKVIIIKGTGIIKPTMAIILPLFFFFLYKLGKK